MGIIYEAMRKIEENEKIWNIDEADKFIQFYDFIDLLELYADDSKKLIIEFLTDDEFLKLDFYRLGFISLDKNGVEIDEESIDENTDRAFIESLNHQIVYIQHNYDDYKDDEHIDYPTECFLEQVLDKNIDDAYNDKYWKVENILGLNSIASIGLDAKAFNECHEALSTDARTTLNYIRERKEFEARLIAEQKRAAKSHEIDPKMYDIAIKKADEQDEYIRKLLKDIENLKQKPISNNDKPMHPRTANNASKIIAALTSELLKMDLTQPFTSDTNGKIRKAIERQGNAVSKDVIGNWLKLAHENSI